MTAFVPPDPDAHRLSAYDYHLPEHLIAQRPVEPRDASRLLVVERARPYGRAGMRIHHGRFRDLPNWLRPGDVLVVNETRVMPARLEGRRHGTGGRAEFLLLGPVDGSEGEWRALARPARRLRTGTVVDVPGGITAVVVGEEPDGVRRVRLRATEGDLKNDALREALARAGRVPLPPYIREPLADPERYQTVYAREEGSVAAPTAGLHFTPDLLRRVRACGVDVVPLVLHVGRGTFQPVEVEDVREHVMEEERFDIPEGTARAVAAAHARGNRVIAVGTTATRALESAALGAGRVRPGPGTTRLFIRPGFPFRVIHGLLTNFHLPRSTLLMLVSAFMGRRETLAVYREAVEQGYRFYSFGDAMLIV